MSIVKIRATLEEALTGIDLAFPTVYENITYAPVDGVPYKCAYLILAAPDNPVLGSAFHRELGIFQVNLYYPLQSGTATVSANADAIRNAFKRGNSFSKDGQVITVEKTPEILQGVVEADRWMQSIKIRFYANSTTS